MTATRARTRYPYISKVTQPGRNPFWHYRRTQTNPVTKKRDEWDRKFATESGAKEYADQVADDIAKGATPSAKARTVADACAGYLRIKTEGKKVTGNTLEGYRVQLGYLTAFVADEHPGLPIADLTVDHLLDLRLKLRTTGAVRADGRQGAPLSATSANYCIKIIGQMLRMEFRQRHVPGVVTDLMDTEDNDTAERPTFTKEQCEHLFANTIFDRNRVAWRLALYGLRRGEIAGLRWEDVDLEKMILSIRRSRVVDDSRVVIKTTKTKKGIRELPISDKLAADLRDHHDLIESERNFLGVYYRDRGFIVVDESGMEPTPPVITDWWDRMLVKIDLPAIHLHDARHTAATLFRLDGAPAPVIAAWLGHANVAMTEHYSHSQDAALMALGGSSIANL